MKMRKIPWRITTLLMFILCFAAIWMMFANGLMDMVNNVILNVVMGAMAMTSVIMLCLAHSMDHTPEDESTPLFYLLLVITYVGLLGDNFSWFFDGDPNLTWPGLIWLNQILCLLSYLVSALIAPIFMLYQRVVLNIRKQDRVVKWVNIFMVLDLIFLAAGAMSGFLYRIDEYGHFQSGFGHWMSALYPVFIFIICISDNIRQKMEMRKRLSLMIFIFTPLTGLFSAFYSDYAVIYVAVTFSLMLMYFAVQMERSIERMEQARKIAEQSRELTEKQTQIIMSQIQPHFVYNTLGSISSLCEEDPIQARDVTDQFARYLRVNMANTKNDRLIPFDEEWEHTKTYLWIEQIRFEDYLKVVNDIQCTDFRLPPLTLQPLVENAVKHGITPKAEGGTVTISTYEEADCYVVQICDDGLGFDVEMPAKDGKLHVGIENVKTRLEILCRGKLKIESRVGVGTVAKIILPKEKPAE